MVIVLTVAATAVVVNRTAVVNQAVRLAAVTVPADAASRWRAKSGSVVMHRAFPSALAQDLSAATADATQAVAVILAAGVNLLVAANLTVAARPLVLMPAAVETLAAGLKDVACSAVSMPG